MKPVSKKRWWNIFLFPDPENANSDGLLAMGGDLSLATLQSAYTQGIFPWPQEGFPLLWFSPPQRGVLFFEKFKVPKTTQKAINKNTFQITINEAFSDVIRSCAKIPRDKESGTWILPEMIEAYENLHLKGYAKSVEAWVDGDLVGGLYGVDFEGLFSGESMFFKTSEASKVCLVALVEELQKEGRTWMDIQMVTPLLEQFGGEYIPRKKFLDMLKASS
ncbi:MAG: leucyl/phenylalanyl-tRNA--protein transferase [Pseudomonadota bacterium]